jgi:hypothetical protein
VCFSLYVVFSKNVRDSFGEGVRGTEKVERGVRVTRKFEKRWCMLVPRLFFSET